LFADAQDAPGQIALAGPELNQRVLALGVEFAVESSEARKPLAVFADFAAPGNCEILQHAAEFGPIVHSQTAVRLETVSACY